MSVRIPRWFDKSWLNNQLLSRSLFGVFLPERIGWTALKWIFLGLTENCMKTLLFGGKKTGFPFSIGHGWLYLR